MAAGTEGFNDTSQPGKDHMGAMISKVIAARKFAREEREAAEEKAKKAGYDSLDELGVEKGFFFKAALKSKFGGSYISGKKQDIQQTVDRVKLLKNPKAQFWNFVDNRDASGKEIKKLSEVERFREQFDNYAFVSAKRAPEKVESSEEMIPDTAEETASSASGTGKSRVSREDILTAVSAIASSLEQTAQSINNTLGETKNIASDVQAIKTDVIAQLSERTDTIEAKLDAIAAAINAQTALQKKTTDDKQGAQKMSGGAAVKNAADSSDFDDLSTPEDEGEESDLDADNIADTPSQEPAADDPNKPPEAETGGIVSGPDSGYLAKLHGDEMVVPLDNNYTQGEPSAMDGKVRPVPETPAMTPKTSAVSSKPQSFEKGTSNLGGKVGFTDLNLGMASKSSSGADAMAQPLMDAMSLPMMVAGGTVLSSVTNLMNQLGPESDSFAGEIAKVARPIADVFGLPNSLANKVTGQKSSNGGDSDSIDRDRKKNKKKGFFGNFMEMLKGITGGGGGGGNNNTTTTTADPNFTGSENSEKAMNYFMSQGLTKEQAAGIAGNLQQESTFNPRADNTGTGEGDTEGHYGIAQWDKKIRWPKVKKWMLEHNLDPFSLEGQLQALKWEAGERGDWERLKQETTAKGAAKSFLSEFEKSGEEPGEAGYEARMQNAVNFASKDYAPSTSPSVTTPSPEAGPGADTSSTPAAKPQVDSAQKITENFGLKPGQKFFFMHKKNGVDLQFEAYKTTKGFDIYQHGGRIGSMKLQTADGKNDDVVTSLIKAGRARAAISSPTASETPGQTQAALQKPDKNTGGSGATKVAMLNTSAGQPQSAGTDKPPTPEQTVVKEGHTNDLTSMYASPLVVG